MKKFYTIIAALLMGISGAWATVTQPTLTTDSNNPVYYTIKSLRSSKYVSYVGRSTQLNQIAAANYTTLWYFVANGEGVSIVPAADPSVKLATNASATVDGAVWYLKENTYNAGYFCISLKSDLSANCWDDNNGKIGYWQPSASDYQGTSWIIEPSSVTFNDRKNAIDAIISNLPDVLKPTAKMTAFTNATTDVALRAAVADFSTNVNFKCRSNKYLVVGDSRGSFVDTPSNNEEIIQLESVGDGSFYIKGFMSMKYMGDVAMSTAIQTEATANIPYYIQAYNDYAVARPTKYADNGYNYIHNGGSGCVGWSADGTNTQFTIQEVSLPDGLVAVTYNVELDGNIVASETVRQATGATAAVPASLVRDYTTYSYSVNTVPANDVTITATATVSGLPFTVSTDYSTATWYYLHGHASYSNTYISTNGTATVYAENKSATDAYKWAFIGDPITGIKVINKASGESSYLMATDPATMGSTPKAWTLKKQTNTGWQSGANGFGLYDAARTYLNTQGTTLKYWGSFDQGSTYWVEVVPQVTVTFNLEVNSEIANTLERIVTEGETVSVPTELWTNYNTSLGYTITGNEDVTVGTTNQIVNVTATPKTGVVTSLSALSNNKAYRLVTERGTFTTDNGELANTAKNNSNYTVYNFAIVNYDNAYYLWSVQDGKFVAGDGTALTNTPTAITLNELSTKPLIKFQCGSNYMNCNANGCSFGSWSTTDAGNSVAIIEAADFDPTPVINAINNVASSVVANIKPFFDAAGSDLFQLKASVAQTYDATYTAALTMCSTTTYNELLAVVSDAENFNLPEDGKYYIVKNVSNDKYLNVNVGGRSNGLIKADLDAPLATSIVKARTDGNGYRYLGSQGKELGWTYGSDATNYGPFLEENEGKHVHYKVTVPGQAAFELALGNGEGEYAGYANTGYYQVNGSNEITGGAYTGATAQWTFEEVTTMNVALNAIGSAYYATLCVPFDYTISGATAYTLALNANGTALDMTEVSGTVTAGTPVVLVGSSNSATLTIGSGYASAPLTTTALTGQYLAATIPAGASSNNYFLGRLNGEPGFYRYSGESLALGANRAYLTMSGSGSNGFSLILDDDDVTAVASAIDAQSSAINGQYYDLTGRKVASPQKGQIYLVNGKKILY
ncbi:MAG: hypothetical protein J6129_05490 [Bacteroidaceae bacterium]|nr:hypothetical protein [Bacteroidaceae bacterium]